MEKLENEPASTRRRSRSTKEQRHRLVFFFYSLSTRGNGISSVDGGEMCTMHVIVFP
jgi:hypothetical protein